MAEKSSFFNSVSGDRKYSAEDWAAYFASFIGNGVYAAPSNGLQVVASTGMGITIKTGSGFINGYFYQLTADLSKTLSVADGIYSRIDRVVLRWNLLDRRMYVHVLEGTPSSTPTPQPLTREVETYEIALADVYVGQGVTEIIQANITDLRTNTTLCGIVTAVIDQYDFSVFTAQFESFFADYRARIVAEYNYWSQMGQSRYDSLDATMDAFEESAQTSFNEWFANLQYVLDGDVAGHLQNEIDAMQDVVDAAVEDLTEQMEATIEEVRLTGFSTYTHAKVGTVHSLTLLHGGSNIKFVATATFNKNDTFTVNGDAVTVLLPNGKAPGNKAFVSGATVICFLSGSYLYMVGGGGGGSGEQFLAAIATSSWYAQQPDANDEFWYAVDITPADFDSSEQDVQVSAANAATYEWLSNNAYYELAISSNKFTLQAKAIPGFNLQIFYELKTRGGL